MFFKKLSRAEDRYREIKRSGDYVEIDGSKVVSEPKKEEKRL